MSEVKQYEGREYDVIVVGAGHAGSEAALAAARMGNKTLLMTINLDMVAFMPCNPSIGGPAKGIVVREIDALGGEMGRNIDKTYVQMRMLNTGKGPAVRALRAQADKHAYHAEMKKTIEAEPNLTLRQGIVDDLIVEDGVCKGVITNTGARYQAKSVVLTLGTAARGKIIIGELQYSSGPNNSQAALELTKNLTEKYHFDLERFKTGTPPRVDGGTINYDETEEQPGDEVPNHFSFQTPDSKYIELKNQLSCWLTYTNEKTHEIIRENLDRAPMFSGMIEGVGPRYCPSIEDKIVRFADKSRHQLFLEPEGRKTDEWYVQGLSTSMPEEVQQQILHSIKGLEEAEMMRPGYAIEYDVVAPYQLKNTLETKLVKNLYTAGQTNGTSGYEEAAGQGLIAGINAGRRALGKEPLTLKRSDAYIGVMIDDLVTKGTKEPYRLLTSRAEYRLILRHDNADLRLTEVGHNLGLVSDEEYNAFLEKKQDIKDELQRLSEIRIKPSQVQEFLESKGSNGLKDGVLASEFLRRPEVNYSDLLKFIDAPEKDLDRRVIEQVEIETKYAGYIKKAQDRVDRLKRMEEKAIPDRIDYEAINGLATEGRQKLEKIRPTTIAQASRISGVTPADIAILSVYIQQGKIAKIAE
ncbi:tRNA uridine-5-carboxymethylaminomethyl(34) synthesis enzyme MnmG [Pediococcus pentosaceus]|mgnify:FL=1|jgi:tRNA uridine 5-carboxymethylaminomethyl modification enzyme|uniref:tRNA uridine 5-carboxymethylaminomethyl modification enzyme MnmG n=2 Tax=Pediococcus pentosaceus TaxID=1255 RepID=A0A0Q1A176_PEDPE|nr:tRNA uridine-5-carboxymethylaminomethyl(34) synthesis enzyme MnmG [Pediococcus pentosaceus]ANI97154.1 tRNA uridine(34) 5-carboxymethylaminomethyl synthesis enzyme MnmG [Pediococcus pentosaceus]ARW18759.1 tRNA uridine 5-carboxymethylaminomethyl modification enzyme MnmG [Pediococcus pentosaceus]ASC07635.1 tRNA uridine 5-carboxymethylaminomethyl modification enzyme MnmG [Pediococcus pentosaceus]AVL02265.1 tRNA uridine-5-carboxymethylaminomethyl(34) synthesis enzyme MnmG [Pediococcus pentosaceus